MVLEYKEGASQSETQGTEMVGGLIRNSSFPGQEAEIIMIIVFKKTNKQKKPKKKTTPLKNVCNKILSVY